MKSTICCMEAFQSGEKEWREQKRHKAKDAAHMAASFESGGMERLDAYAKFAGVLLTGVGIEIIRRTPFEF
jgi:hypothetical protein